MNYIKISDDDYRNAFSFLFSRYVSEIYVECGNQEIINYHCVLHTNLYTTIDIAKQSHSNNILKNTVKDIVESKHNKITKINILQALNYFINMKKEIFDNEFKNMLLFSCYKI